MWRKKLIFFKNYFRHCLHLQLLTIYKIGFTYFSYCTAYVNYSCWRFFYHIKIYRARNYVTISILIKDWSYDCVPLKCWYKTWANSNKYKKLFFTQFLWFGTLVTFKFDSECFYNVRFECSVSDVYGNTYGIQFFLLLMREVLKFPFTQIVNNLSLIHI